MALIFMGNGKTGGWFNAANLALHAFFTTQTMVVNDDVVEHGRI